MVGAPGVPRLGFWEKSFHGGEERKREICAAGSLEITPCKTSGAEREAGRAETCWEETWSSCSQRRLSESANAAFDRRHILSCCFVWIHSTHKCVRTVLQL